MGKWTILRGGARYEGYTSRQLLEMQASNELLLSDAFMDEKGRSFELGRAQRIWTKENRPRRSHKGLITLGVIVLVIGGLTTWFLLTKVSDNIKTGPRTTAVQTRLPKAGGTVSVAGGTIKGMTIGVPGGAYKNGSTFTVSTRPITGNRFGNLFTPVTPLITVDNGHAFAGEPMTVSIPITKASDEYAMAFYYDEKSGKLEGMPTVSLDNSHITFITNHFTDLVVSKVRYSLLTGLTIDSGFTPGIDDWQFRNRGSWIAAGGHCAGQSLTALWYYSEIFEKKGEARLYDHFDNNDYGVKTPRLWQDDSDAYRFASTVQASLDADDLLYKAELKLSGMSAANTLYAFKYAMALTGEPQYLEIWRTYTTADNKPARGGHAIIAYKIVNESIYVCDPNWPAAGDRTIVFKNSAFEPYASGQNANDIAAGNIHVYPEIYFIGKTALVDYSVISTQYQKMLAGTVGDDKFPGYVLKLMKSYNAATNSGVFIECPDVIKTSTEELDKFAGNSKGKLTFKLNNTYPNFKVYIYSGLQSTAPAATFTPNAGSYSVGFNYKPEPGDNDLGILIVMIDTATGKEYYDDFKRIKIEFDKTDTFEFEKDSYTVVAGNKVVYKIKSSETKDVKYVWNFGDGSGAIETDKPETSFIYKSGGDNTAACALISTKNNKQIASAETAVTVIDPYGKWNYDFKITRADAADAMANYIMDGILKIIKMIFPSADIPASANVKIEGTTIGCVLTVSKPADGGKSGRIPISLQEVSSSTDFVDIVKEPLTGYMTISDDKCSIVITGQGESSGTTPSALSFNGRFLNGVLYGTFTASGMMSGDFSAAKQ